MIPIQQGLLPSNQHLLVDASLYKYLLQMNQTIESSETSSMEVDTKGNVCLQTYFSRNALTFPIRAESVCFPVANVIVGGIKYIIINYLQRKGVKFPHSYALE